jgi:O-methyltransferase
LRIADFLLGFQACAWVAECGCYKGGASAKLSLVAKATGRTLLVCDSFEGLPAPAAVDQGLVTMHNQPYAMGMYAGAFDEVKSNITLFGTADVCKFSKGYFADTLPHLPQHDLACAFVDVDLISSARDCLRALWPRLVPGGRLYLHEARDLRFIQGVTERSWWEKELGQSTPLLIGAGFGCGDCAPQLAYFDKTAA